MKYAAIFYLLEIRLTGGRSPNEGRVEVLLGHNWGTVCSEGWNVNSARVVCRQLGLGEPLELKTYEFGPGNGDIHLKDVNCTGSEVSLFQCQHSLSGRHSCDHSQDVGVVCYGI